MASPLSRLFLRRGFVAFSMCRTISAAMNNHTYDRDFFRKLMQFVCDEAIVTDRKKPVVEFHHPLDLQSVVDLSLTDKGCPDDKLIELCRTIVRYSVKTGHPFFFNQLFQGFSEYGIGGAIVTEVLNTSAYTFEMAPVFSLMENLVLAELRKLVGFPADDGDGIFCPGGSLANMYAINLARFRRFPDVKQSGVRALPPVRIFTSEQSHYSMSKGVSFMGMGLSSLVAVGCDDRGRMVPAQLRAAISACLNEVQSLEFPPPDLICAEHGIWLHCDAAWGGGALFSPRQRHRLTGIDRADSVTWCLHKMLGAPLQCSAFLTKHQGMLAACHSAGATYLFQQDKFYDVSFDTGDKSLQCGRKVDAFKLWLMWKARGFSGLADDIDVMFARAQSLVEAIQARRSAFIFVVEQPEFTNVSFWFIPPRLRPQIRDKSINDARSLLERTSPEFRRELGKVAPALKERLTMEGSMMVSYQPLGELPNFFRMILSNPETVDDDLSTLLDTIERLGADL